MSEAACRRIISSYRMKVDWMMHIPEWEPFYTRGLLALDFQQPRRGINLRILLSSLPLQNKHELITWTCWQFKGSFSSDNAIRLAESFSFPFHRRKDLDVNLSNSQWNLFLERFHLAFQESHRRYKHAQDVLFRRYQSLLHKMVNRQVFDPRKRADAFQEASLGLIHAIDKVDDSTASFGSYARTWIGRQIRNYLMGEHFPVHVPINLASKILRQHSQHHQDGSADSLSGDLKGSNITPLPDPSPAVSFDSLSSSDSEMESLFEDTEAKAPSTQFVEKDLHRFLREHLSLLTAKQREVVARRFGLEGHSEGKTLCRIADEVGISHQQVSLREKRALQKLEASLKPLFDELLT